MIEPQRAKAFLSELDAALAASAEPARTAMQLIAKHFQHYHWVGIYWLHGDTLVLGPFVGTATEHTRIKIGQGVCGTAVAQNKNQIIADVRQLDNYLACSLKTRAEIVVLIRRDGRILGQIDADADETAAFDASDEALLEAIAERIAILP